MRLSLRLVAKICFAAGLLFPNLVLARQAPLAEQPTSIGYPTVAAALADLPSRPGVTMSEQAGWTVATDARSRTLWSFAPVGHPAYPAMVKRQILSTDHGVDMKMEVLCEADKAPCDDLVRTFQQLNARMKQGLRR
jgi:hypothetical protein